MKNSKIPIFLVATILGIFLISMASATLTQDLFSNDCTNLEITIDEHSSQINFYFNSEDYEWDELENIEIEGVGNISLTNQTLSEFLEGLNFKIENEGGQLKFTSAEVLTNVTQEILYMIYQTYESIDYEEFIDYVTNENLLVGLLNEFLEDEQTDLLIEDTMSLQKSGNNYIYQIDDGWGDVDIEEIVEEATQVFYISDILSEIGIDNIYDLDFSMQLEGLDEIPQKNGNYNLNLKVIEENETYNKNIKLNLKGFEETPVPLTSRGKSHDDEKKEEKPRVFLIGKQSIENGYLQKLIKGESMEFTLAEKHSIQVLEIYKSGQIKLKIQSDPIYAYMTEGQKRTFNLSENEVLSIEVVELNKDNVEIMVKGEVLVLPEESIDLSSEEENKGFFRLTGAAIGNFVKSDSALPVGLIIIFIALIFVLVGVLRKRK